MGATATQRAWNGVSNSNVPFLADQPKVKDEDETEFDREVRRLRLTQFELVSSIALRYWAKRYKNMRYVPEELLSAWGMKVNSDFGGM
jgi:hypothetical protein